jgi:hypothetical protein
MRIFPFSKSRGAKLRKRERERQPVHGPEQVHRRAVALDDADVGARAADVERDELLLAREPR